MSTKSHIHEIADTTTEAKENDLILTTIRPGPFDHTAKQGIRVSLEILDEKGVTTGFARYATVDWREDDMCEVAQACLEDCLEQHGEHLLAEADAYDAKETLLNDVDDGVDQAITDLQLIANMTDDAHVDQMVCALAGSLAAIQKRLRGGAVGDTEEEAV